MTPLSLGIETLGGVFTKLIERNTTIPSKKSEIFSTAADGQTSVEVHVQQGAREMAQFNKTLGKFHLTDIPQAPRGVPQIEVTFDIDANGIVHVLAKDLGTGKEQKITITASSGLDKSEVERMVNEAESHATEDQAAREAADTRNRVDQMVYQVEKTLSENAEKFTDEDKKPIEEAVQEVKSALEKGDVEAIKAAGDRLEKASHKLAEIMYKTGAAPGGAEPGAGGPESAAGTPEEDVIDAEVVDEGKTN